MPLHIFSSTIFEMNLNEISKVCCEETQNGNKHVVSANSSSKNFLNFQEKHPPEIAF